MNELIKRKFIFYLRRVADSDVFEVEFVRYLKMADRPVAQQEVEVKELLDNGIIAKLNSWFRKMDQEGDEVHGYGPLPKNREQYAVAFSDESFADLLIAYYQDYE